MLFFCFIFRYTVKFSRQSPMCSERIAANEAAACRRRGYRKGSNESQRCCSALPLGRVAPPLVANCTLEAVDLFLLIFSNYLTKFNFSHCKPFNHIIAYPFSEDERRDLSLDLSPLLPSVL